jgi:hypothetical protein
MGQGVSAPAAFGTKVRTTVFDELSAAGAITPLIVQETNGGQSVPVCAPHKIFGNAADIQTQGIGATPSPDDHMTGGAICARLRAPHTTDDLDDLPHLQGAGARVYPIAPRPDFFGGRV